MVLLKTKGSKEYDKKPNAWCADRRVTFQRISVNEDEQSEGLFHLGHERRKRRIYDSQYGWGNRTDFP